VISQVLRNKVSKINELRVVLSLPVRLGALAAIEVSSNRKHDALTGSSGFAHAGARCSEWFGLRFAYAVACGMFDAGIFW
jgi:hypothetical protein